MSFQAPLVALQGFLDRHPGARRFAPVVAGLACLLAALVLAFLVARETVGGAFTTEHIVTFEAHLPTRDAAGLGAEIARAAQADARVRERVVVGRGKAALVALRVAGTHEDSLAAGRRVVMLLPADVRVFEPVAWPLLPGRPGLFTRFGESEARATFANDAAQTANAWIRAGGEGLPKERKVVVVIDPERLARTGLAHADVEKALARGFARRPPLPDVDARRVLPSAWDAPADAGGGVLQRAMALTVEGSDGKETPLADVASFRWSVEAAPASAPDRVRGDHAPYFATRPWLREDASRRNAEAARPWTSSWSRQDVIVLSGLLLAAVCAAVAMMGTIGAPVDVGFACAFSLAFGALHAVAPALGDAPVPQAPLLLAASLLWCAFRFLPWRLTVRARAVWNVLQGAFFLGVVAVLSSGTSDGAGGAGGVGSMGATVVDARSASTSLSTNAGANAIGGLVPGAAGSALAAPFRLADGDVRALAPDGTHDALGPKPDLARFDVETSTGPVAVVLRAPSRPDVPPAKYTVSREGAPASLGANDDDASAHRADDATRRISAWVGVSLGAGVLAAALMGLGASAWLVNVVVQLVAGVGCAAWATLLARVSGSGSEGPSSGAFQYEILVPWTMGLVALLAIWLTARAQRLQARQVDPVDALRIARRHVQRTAFTFLACAGFLWPTVLLLDRFVSVTVLVTFGLSALFLLPCVAVALGQKFQDAFAYRRLAGRVRGLVRRRTPGVSP